MRLLGRPFPMVFSLAGYEPKDLPGDDGKPYGEAVVVAEPGESVARVLDRAAIRLGLTSLQHGSPSAGLAWIRFRQADGDRFAYDERLLWAQRTTILDAEGRVRLDRRLDQITVADLLRTAEAGLIDGDPLQPYLIPTIPQGGVEPWGLDWSALIGYLQLFWTALGAVTTVDGTISVARRLRERLRRAPEALAERQLRGGGTPELLWDVFQHRPVLPEDAARWLDCSREEAETVLLALGLDDRGDGLWAPGSTHDARVMGDALLELRERWELGGENPDQTLVTRLQHLAETGERLPIPDRAAWERQLGLGADADDEEIGGALDDEDDDIDDPDAARYELPLPLMQLDCSCGDPGCTATARITYVGRDRLRITSDSSDGHFVVASGFVERLIEEQLDAEG